MTAPCAVCGTITELCNSVTSSGIKQPRYCKGCLCKTLSEGDQKINPIYWLRQLRIAKETESIEKLMGSTNEQTTNTRMGM